MNQIVPDMNETISKKHKILLIGMPWWTVEQPYYALAYVGGVINKCGWECTIEDLNVKIYRHVSDEDKNLWNSGQTWSNKNTADALYDKYSNYINSYLKGLVNRNNFNIISFSINPWTKHCVLKAAKYVRTLLPDVTILFGGLECFPAYSGIKLLDNTDRVPDIICRGECEIALPKFLKQFETSNDYQTDIKGFAYGSKNGVVDNDEPELPDLFASDVIADYSQFDFTVYTGLGGFPTFLTRGCINRCNFCSESPNFKRFRYRNPAVVIKEILEGIKYASKVSNVYHIMFAESMHNGHAAIFEEFVDLLIAVKKKHTIIWTSIMGFREQLSDQVIAKMHQSGCWRVFWGFESGSQHVIGLMKKNYKLENAKRIISSCHRLGIQNLLPLIIGFPGESTDDVLECIDFVLRYRTDGTFLDPDNMYIYPNSNLHTKYKDFGMANNHVTDWFTEDNRNNPSIRLFRTFIVRSLLHNASNWNVASIDTLDFNDFSLASEIAAISYGVGIKLQNKADVKNYLERWEPSPNKSISDNDLQYWHPAIVPHEISLQNWFTADKNNETNRRKIITYIMNAIFKHEISIIPSLPHISTLTMLSSKTKYGIEISGSELKSKAPISVNSDDLFIEGWAIDTTNHGVAGGVIIKIDDQLFPARYGFRQQSVLNELGERYTNSGYSRRIYISEIGKGAHKLSLFVLSNDSKAYFNPERSFQIILE